LAKIFLMIRAAITAVSAYLPEYVLTNKELETMVDTNDEWITSRSGIKERRILRDKDKATSFMATEAAKSLLQKRNIKATDLDLIIVATSSPDRISPSTAIIMAKRLDIQKPAFDINAVCTGFVYGLQMASSLIGTKQYKNILLIGSDAYSRITDWEKRDCVFFGDGAGAVLLEASAEPGVLASRLHADGRHEGILRTPGNVCGGAVIGSPLLTMDGQAVFKLAVSVLDSVGREVLANAQLSIDQLDWLIPHQANVRILQATARRMGLDSSKVVVTVDQHANTSAASVPLALDVAVRDGRIREGQHVLLEGVGGGFAWGAVLVRMTGAH
jgi:3-oxoacyl-[acyl-carrier-protein] synthase-3